MSEMTQSINFAKFINGLGEREADGWNTERAQKFRLFVLRLEYCTPEGSISNYMLGEALRAFKEKEKQQAKSINEQTGGENKKYG